MVSAEKKRLLVEGTDDLYAIVQLMASHISWGDQKKDWPVHIKACGGAGHIIEDVPLWLKSREAEILGIVIDADNNMTNRWNSLRPLCVGMFPTIPTILPPTGLIAENTTEGKRLGIWIMPDNQSRGMMETFMKFLVPQDNESRGIIKTVMQCVVPSIQNRIWLHAEKSTSSAKRKGAKYRLTHKEKANLYTWLAWQDEPAQSMGTALVKNILNPNAAYAAPFISWFRELFEL